jgi:hypothetical protein
MLRGIIARACGAAALLALSGPAFPVSAANEHSPGDRAYQRSLGADLADKDIARSRRADSPAAFMSTAIRCRYLAVRRDPELRDWTWCADRDLWQGPFNADQLEGYLQRLKRPH